MNLLDVLGIASQVIACAEDRMTAHQMAKCLHKWRLFETALNHISQDVVILRGVRTSVHSEKSGQPAASSSDTHRLRPQAPAHDPRCSAMQKAESRARPARAPPVPRSRRKGSPPWGARTSPETKTPAQVPLPARVLSRSESTSRRTRRNCHSDRRPAHQGLVARSRQVRSRPATPAPRSVRWRHPVREAVVPCDPACRWALAEIA